MLVQHTPTHLKLIRQHDHGTLCGKLAHTWDTPLSFELLLAIALHDLPWVRHDATPRLNPDTQRPYSFIDYPRQARLDLYSEGLDELERVHPYVGLLVSLHYTTFRGTLGLEPFQTTERTRREELAEHVFATPEQLQRDLAWVKMLDLLSLYICLTPPGALPESRPQWLLPDDTLTLPDGSHMALEWASKAHLRLTPNPLGEELTVRIPVMTLEGASWRSQGELDKAVAGATWEAWEVEIGG